MKDTEFFLDKENPDAKYVVKINQTIIYFYAQIPDNHFKHYSIETPARNDSSITINEIENFDFGSFPIRFIKKNNNEIRHGSLGVSLKLRIFNKIDPQNPYESFKKIYQGMAQNDRLIRHESFSNIPKDVQFFELLINGRKWLNFFSGTSSYSYHYFFYTFIDDWILAFNVYEHGINSPPKELDLETLKIVQNLMVEFLEVVNIYDENDPEVKDLPSPGAYPPAGETIAERDEPLW